MERVKRGERYWVVYLIGDKCKTCMMIAGQNSPATPTYDSDCFQFGNYFSSEASAEAMAEKIRKVLKGADVIEMPSEDDIADKIYNTSGEVVGREGEISVSHCIRTAKIVVEWLKSKCIR